MDAVLALEQQSLVPLIILVYFTSLKQFFCHYMITLSMQLVNSMSPAFVCLIYRLLLIPLTIPFCWSACLSGLEFMALYLLGLDLIFPTGHSV